jgi:mRNA-degrading endonuclease RelE of RelBE toxin-antitoxin system
MKSCYPSLSTDRASKLPSCVRLTLRVCLHRAIPLGEMYQVTFSEQAMQELNKLDKLAQLEAIDPLGALKASDLAAPREPLGRFNREGKELYRLRSGDSRFYFQVNGDTLHVCYILHSNSLEDFLLRNKLPVSEQQLAEQHSKFWKYLESLRK